MATKLESQDFAIKVINRILDNYMKSQGQIRPHFILSGKSGTGKSFILEKLGQKHAMSVLNINAAQLTREGISGNSLSKALEPLKKLQNKPVIVLFDEFDKLFTGAGGDSGDVRSGVQSEILHIISSGVCQVIADYGHYNELSTRNVLFIFAGAFMGEQNLSPDKLLKMGMFPELLGRVNIHIELPDIDCEEMVKAMEKDPLLINYFTTHAIADKEKQTEIKEAIAVEIRKNFKTNIIGYRLITRLIHQYFIFDGVFPQYVLDQDELDELDAITEEFQKEIAFGE